MICLCHSVSFFHLWLIFGPWAVRAHSHGKRMQQGNWPHKMEGSLTPMIYQARSATAPLTSHTATDNWQDLWPWRSTLQPWENYWTCLILYGIWWWSIELCWVTLEMERGSLEWRAHRIGCWVWLDAEPPLASRFSHHHGLCHKYTLPKFLDQVKWPNSMAIASPPVPPH